MSNGNTEQCANPMPPSRRLDPLRLWQPGAGGGGSLDEADEYAAAGFSGGGVGPLSDAGGGSSGADADSAALPPGTCIAVQLDARGGRLHDWLARKVTGKLSLFLQCLIFPSLRPPSLTRATMHLHAWSAYPARSQMCNILTAMPC